jgi:hypothetical protein
MGLLAAVKLIVISIGVAGTREQTRPRRPREQDGRPTLSPQMCLLVLLPHDVLAAAMLSCVAPAQSKRRISASANTSRAIGEYECEKAKLAVVQVTLEAFSSAIPVFARAGVEPPPQAQHMTLAVKSSSSVVVHIAGVRTPAPEQFILYMSVAPSSVSVHGAGVLQNKPDPHVPVAEEQHWSAVHVVPVSGPHCKLLIG